MITPSTNILSITTPIVEETVITSTVNTVNVDISPIVNTQTTSDVSLKDYKITYLAKAFFNKIKHILNDVKEKIIDFAVSAKDSLANIRNYLLENCTFPNDFAREFVIGLLNVFLVSIGIFLAISFMAALAG